MIERNNMFDLNGEDFQVKTIFNGGKAGLVRNVAISVELKQDQGSNSPDFKLIATDASGSVNSGFYYITPNPQKSADDNAKWEKLMVGRVLHAAKAVMGADYSFPSVSSSKEAFDVLFKLISENSSNKKFNIYTTYGTPTRPSKYLGFRFFNFIEPANDGSTTTLYPSNSDLLTQIEPDKNDSDLNFTM